MLYFYFGGGLTVVALIAWAIVAIINNGKESRREQAELISDSIKNASGNNRPLSYEEFQEMKRKAQEDPSYAKYLKSQGIDISE